MSTIPRRPPRRSPRARIHRPMKCRWPTAA